MAALKIINSAQINATIVPNDFIDHYMTHSNGEFVKVYIFLLRHVNQPDSMLTLSMIADELHHTENDIYRALRYWESESLITLQENAGQITGIIFNNSGSEQDSVINHTQDLSSESVVNDFLPEEPDTYSSLEHARKLDDMKNRNEWKNLIYVTEQYTGKTLTPSEVNLLYSFHEELGLSLSLIEYLIETCVEHGHKSFRYIEKVAISWADQKIQTIPQAQAHESAFEKDYYTILKAFGIRDRAAVSGEKSLMDKWIDEWAFSMDIILEACNRTMNALHRPSFEYADSILSSWFKDNVHSLKDIEALDQNFQQERKSKSVKTKPVSKNNNNFERRTYDMDSLESQLLKK